MNIQTILQQIEEGDRDAFTTLVRYFQQPLFGYLGRMGLNQSLAEEVAQETFVRVWQNLASYDLKRAEFSTWLFTIARRLAINEMSRKYYQTEYVADVSGLSVAKYDVGLEQLDRQNRLRKAMLALSMNDRNLLALAYTKGLDMKCLAGIEEISVGAVKVRLHRAKQRLMEILEERDEEKY